jgi:hypothetical protein
MLTEHSGRLFLWVFMACQVIADGTMGLQEMELLIHFVSSVDRLDGLYLELLQRAFNEEDNTIVCCFKLVMGRILAMRNFFPYLLIQSCKVKMNLPN